MTTRDYRINQLVTEVKRVQRKVLIAGRLKPSESKDALLTSYNRQIRKHAGKITDLGGNLQLLSMRNSWRKQK